MPRVSVIVPAFDAAATLAETLTSVVEQTYDDWEVVVGDDCSTDATAAIAAGFPRTRVVRTEGRAGPAGARNAALAAATGELVAFLDADDLWEPDFLATQVARYDAEERRSPGVGIVACDARLLGDDGMLPYTHGDWMGSPEGIALAELLARNPIYVSVVAPLAVVREVGGFDPAAWGSEDHDLWIRIVESGRRVVATPRTLAVYRMAGASVSTDTLRMARTNQVTYRRALERGRLGPRESRIAARELRLHETVERLVVARRARSLGGLLGAAPAAARVAVENPRRWRGWLGRLA